ncbi:MAG: NTP transferase domain-containing protein [Candidatus Eisenbacteria bacterium]|uniref:NTP transferase domain-containing protein n=1 Tax=Eiseniibacteriota bacterium TaxID=2212470 RepID=A0A956M1P8_UNCEI|nr:NTP transferase domain-containing protein [Candidatus Eisenbacteria bacterium]
MNQRWSALVLAAGKGTRMKSDLAKVLHPLDGRTLLSCVLDTAARLPLERVIAVVGHQAEQVKEAHRDRNLLYALQEPQLGTGHAVICARPHLEGQEGSLLVLYGDVPLLRPATLLELMERHELGDNGVTVLTARLPDPSGYGRVLRDADGGFRKIIEDRDLAPEQRGIDEINSGIYTFKIPLLLDALSRLRQDNAQGEYYLTDTLEMIREAGHRAGIMEVADHHEISGINTPEQLEDAARVLEMRREAGEGAWGCDVLDTLASRPSLILREREGVIVSLAPHPYNCGHLWITPRRRVVFAESLEPRERAAMMHSEREAEGWLDQAFHPQGVNVGFDSGRAGRQVVMHVIPRWAGDANFMPLVGGVNLLPETLEQTYQRLQPIVAQTS